jgi:trk system potassium uptake protein TrkA
VSEVEVDKWGGKTLRELDLSNRRAVQVIALKAKETRDYTYVPGADQPLNRGDVLVVLGKLTQIAELDP